MDKGFEVYNNGSPISWDDFLHVVRGDCQEVDNINSSNSKSAEPFERISTHSKWIYRGQSNKKWKLETTLERYLKNELAGEFPIKASKYVSYLNSIFPAINSLTTKQFKRPKIQNYTCKHTWHNRNLLQLLAYTRHLGFPSPLMDWSLSYYVASHFAFSQAKQNEDVVIFAFQEWRGEPRGGWVGEPMINHIGHYIETHPRHHLQQSIYTTCTTIKNDELHFENHVDASEANPSDNSIKKFVIAGSERQKVLKELNRMNIND